MDTRLGYAAITVAAVAALAVTLPAQRTAPASNQADTTTRIVKAAQDVVAAVDGPARAKLVFPFESPQKTNWSNLPSGIYKRNSLKIGDLTAPQRAAVMKLLSAALSADGYRKVVDIMHGDEVLKRGGGGRGPAFGEDEYYLAFLGTPSAATPWMLQFGGHHLAINLTLAGSQASMTPSLPAAQPAKFEWEGRTVRPLGSENDKAFALVNALDEKQKGQAILGSRVADLVLGPGQDGKTIQPEGIRASALSAAQQTMLWDVVREWSGIMADSFAEPRLAEIKSHLNDTYFAWSGPTTNGSVIYYRIQGPTLVIEYAPQKSVDHIHTIYRDPTNDYGKKIAAR
jgi:Protein of unknown function (DUF3500)